MSPLYIHTTFFIKIICMIEMCECHWNILNMMFDIHMYFLKCVDTTEVRFRNFRSQTAKFHNLGGKYLKMISKLQVCAELLNQRLISRSVDAEQMFLVML